MRTRRTSLSITVAALAVAACLGAGVPVAAAAPADYEGLPALPVNACHDSALPRTYGTNFPNPSDPFGHGFPNQSAIGWEGNYYAPLAYLSGAYYARGVPARFTQGRTTYCGAMYSFAIADYGLAAGEAPAAGSLKWRMADGHLPALTTSFTRKGVGVSITDFADRQTVDGSPVELVYTRISVHNGTGAAVDAPPGASGPGLITLASGPDKVGPGDTVTHDFVAAVDTFSTGRELPDAAALRDVRPYDAAEAHMRHYWNERLSVIPKLTLPDVALPHTNGLADPGTALEDAYQAAFVYTRIVQVGKAPFSGANNYAWLLNHDVPGILLNRFALGDFTDAQNLLLTGRISERPGFDEVGANWYWDGLWKTPAAWAEYLAKTSDTEFVRRYFHDDAAGDSPWGPSLYTIMHTHYLSQLGPDGYLRASGDNDSFGTWLFDDESALIGLAAYRYIAARIGEAGEADWAARQYDSLLAATNTALAANQQANQFDFLSCEVNRPMAANRCAAPSDANWDGSNMWGQNMWDVFLAGGALRGRLGEPSQTDNLYQMGFARLRGVLPYPTFGAFTGFSTAYNTSYAQAALLGDAYRDLPITSYAWQIATTTGGPNAWWEANGSGPDPDNPWVGDHAPPQFGAIPYAWPLAGQTNTLLQSIVAERLAPDSASGGAPRYHTALYVGRGVPDAWVTPGQTIAASNLTSAYAVGSGARDTYGVRIGVSGAATDRLVHVTLTGKLPSGDVNVQLPAFAHAGVRDVIGGSYDRGTHTVTLTGDRRTVLVRLGNADRPAVDLDLDSTVAGQHVRPTLTAGEPTTATATFTNRGGVAERDVRLSLDVPAGWHSQATTATTFAEVGAGETRTATWTVTPPDDANGGVGLRVGASYDAPFNASGMLSAMRWVDVQRPLPLPPGTTDLALSATPSASYTSPWEHVTAINDGIYPPSSNDTQNTRWGTWPQEGTQWIELDWDHPITTNGSSVYFLDDGGGVRLPASWKVQYWDGSAFVDVAHPSGDPVALDSFNPVTFDPVTTTRMRVVLQSGPASVGVLEWIVPSVARN